MKSPIQKQLEIFSAALECHAGPEREAYLVQACAGDDALRQCVDSLLASHTSAGSFLGKPAGPAGTHLLPFMERLGDKIGRYKLLQQIGEGGCGTVYMAEQEEPIRRRVALKVIRLGMDTKSVIARFEAERQALALMDHPNIAKVFDGGTTESGRPYFVMELVRGIKITDYCDQARLSTAERLKLFIQVCQAVQHAHQKGIIHRDIKPSNILVTVNDGVAVPKVIDFGIAKATDQRLTDKSYFTEFHAFIGTPAYTSPEQAEMSSLDIDTRSDIYSLGVLLYEMLTGQTPFPAERLLQSGLDEMRRIIREEEPPRPSTRLTTLGLAEATELSRKRQVTIPQLASATVGDLDWIVMKCLEKDRTRRYETANGLATDLQRHLDSEPVLARPPSALYKFKKTVCRNKLAFAAGAAMAASLITGLGLSLWMFVKESNARKLAQASAEAERKAKESEASHRKQAQEVSSFLVSVLRSPDPSRDGHTVTVAEVLKRNADELENKFTDDPRTKARLYQTIGWAYVGLGLVEESLPLFEKSVEFFTHGAGENADETLFVKQDLALHYWNAGRPAKALPIAQDLFQARLNKFGFDQPDTILARMAIGNYLFALGRREEGLAEFEAGYKQLSSRWGPEHIDMFWPTTGLADKYRDMGRTQEALVLDESLLKRRIDRLGEDHPDTLHSMRNVGSGYIALKRFDDAVHLLGRAVALSRRKLGPEHMHTLAAIRMFADAQYAQGNFGAAEALLRDALRVSEARSDATSRGQASRTRRRLFALFSLEKRWADAEQMAREEVRVARENASTSPRVLEDALSDWAHVLFRSKRFAEAEVAYRERLTSLQQRHSSTNDKVLTTSASLGRCLVEQAIAERSNPSSLERAREGERLLLECLAVRERDSKLSRGARGDHLSRLADAMLAVTICDTTFAPEARDSRLDEIERIMLSAQELMDKSTSVDPEHHGDGLHRLLRLYELWNGLGPSLERAAQVVKWKQSVDRFEQSQAARKSKAAGYSPEKE